MRGVSKLKRTSKKKRFIFSKPILIIVIIILVLTILILFGTKIYLLINLLLGNDTVIKLTTESSNFFIENGQQQDISFKTTIITNPFCRAECYYLFSDLSSNETLDSGNFNIKTTDSMSKTYTLVANKFESGQKLFAFDISCKSVKTTFCHTKGNVIVKRSLATLNYELNSEQKTKKDALGEQILYSINSFDNISANIEKINLTEISVNSEANNIINKQNSLKAEIWLANQTANNLRSLWEKQKYDFIPNKIDELNSKNKNISIGYNNLIEQINSYNDFVNKLLSINNKLSELKLINTSANYSEIINSEIINYNNLINSNLSLIEKQIMAINLDQRTDVLLIDVKNSSESCCLATEILYATNLTKIILPNENINNSVILGEPNKVCCFGSKCDSCCDSSCASNESLYPVIFLHGHDFNKGTSAEYSLNTFGEMQSDLEKEGYISAGILSISNDESLDGILGLTRNPVSFSASYYFDLYKNTESTILIETKTDNIDRYALRLEDIIEEVKTKTGRDRVIIVTHSMGGLVTREYIRIFGEDAENNIAKIIMIGTPNHGIDKNTKRYCSLFGSSEECEDMGSDSLFINKLNNDNKIGVPVYTIIGTGCSMDSDSKDGDGIVTKDSAYFEGANNNYVNGTCENYEFIYLHSKLVSPTKMPEVYRIVRESLKINSS